MVLSSCNGDRTSEVSATSQLLAPLLEMGRKEPSTKEPEEGSIGTKTIAGRKTISESLNVHLTLENVQHWVGVAGTLALWLQSLVGPISQERESTNCIKRDFFV